MRNIGQVGFVGIVGAVRLLGARLAIRIFVGLLLKTATGLYRSLRARCGLSGFDPLDASLDRGGWCLIGSHRNRLAAFGGR